MFTMSMCTLNTSFVKIWLLVLDLKLNQFLHKESDLTLTFDPSTMNFLQLQAFIDGNFMCEYDQNPCPHLSALSPLISPYFSYQTLLERAKVGSCACKQWRIRMRVLVHKREPNFTNLLAKIRQLYENPLSRCLHCKWKQNVFIRGDTLA